MGIEGVYRTPDGDKAASNLVLSFPIRLVSYITGLILCRQPISPLLLSTTNRPDIVEVNLIGGGAFYVAIDKVHEPRAGGIAVVRSTRPVVPRYHAGERMTWR